MQMFSNDVVVVSLKSSDVLCIFEYYIGGGRCVVSEKTNRNEKYVFNLAQVRKANSDELNKIIYL